MSNSRQLELQPLPAGFSSPIQVFHDYNLGPIGALFGTAVFCADGLAAAVYCISLGWDARWCLGAAGGFAVFMVCVMIWTLYLSCYRVLICPEGFVEISFWGTRGCAWEYIDAVWQKVTDHTFYGVPVSRSCLVTVHCTNGAVFVFDKEKVSYAQKLGDLLEREVCRQRLPEILGALSDGRHFPFGPLSVSNAGLSCSWGSVAWEDVKSVRISAGTVAINKRGKWFSWEKMSAEEIPNLLLFLTLVDAIIGVP